MTSDASAMALVRHYADLGRTRDLDGLGEIFTEDFADHSAAGPRHGLEALRGFLLSVWEWMPDIEVSIEKIFVNKGEDGEPWVGASVILRGATTEGASRIEMAEVWIFRFRDNRISERWSVYDEGQPLPG